MLGAQLKLARIYAEDGAVPKDESKAFRYYQRIADQYADVPASSPIAQYVGEAFCALGLYYVEGIAELPLPADPAYGAGLLRHAGAYFGDAEAQYRLGRLYLTGTGVEKNPSIAANWLTMAARKQHASAQRCWVKCFGAARVSDSGKRKVSRCSCSPKRTPARPVTKRVGSPRPTTGRSRLRIASRCGKPKRCCPV
ncbi:hypothetical protein AUC70_10560 [Methyloceanibacter stevinii]|uniref:Sel1 repeat family protein n=1 Tax=Methyloceanibacter stevinii TaxID=1774970 RepID=A0A1E3VM19_9HYPH|nr:tetratricopeptide repeat protein [Methyloceanibacter stevinii]ODR94016.1 hypothetical protein AUC70_10560 [Methyloceanibacter stevinii]